MSATTTAPNSWPPVPPCWASGWLKENDLATPEGKAAFAALPAGEQMQIAFAQKDQATEAN